MKRKNLLKVSTLALAVAGFYLTSCTASHTAMITNNPVGSKTGKSESGLFSPDSGFSYHEAVKNGGIEKIGVGEAKVKFFIIPFKYSLIVTGE